MKKFLLISLLALYTQTKAQNIGIGNPSPAEKLDVTGNINLTGTIKANGVDGITGQVLQSNGDGTMKWATLGGIFGYQNSKIINFTSNFIVPAGVTKVMVELWSGGAGGSGVAGGMSGSYGRYTKSVSSGGSIQFNIGAGGEGQNGATLPTNGGTISATFPDLTTAQILGAEATIGSGWQGFPGANTGSLNPDYFQNGNLGEIVAPKIYSYPNGSYIEIIDTGRGGFPPGINYNNLSVNSSQYVYKYSNTGSLISQKVQRPPYVVNNYPGTGGGYDNETTGFIGGAGMAIIWW